MYLHALCLRNVRIPISLHQLKSKAFILCCMYQFTLVLNVQVNVSVSPNDNYSIEVVLRCLAVEGDGLGPHEVHDGGILGTVIAAGFKGQKPPVATLFRVCMCYMDMV